MSTVFIGGSRHISRLSEQVKERLCNVIDGGAHIVVGDANGADKAVQKYLTENGYRNVTVYCSGEHARNNVGQWQTRNVLPPRNARGYAFYAAKDRAMALVADFGLMIWDGKSPGTVLNILRLLGAGKKAVLLDVNSRETTTFKTLAHWNQFVSSIGSDLRNDLRKRATPEEWSSPDMPLQASLLERPEPVGEAKRSSAASSKSEDEVAAEINAALAVGDSASVIDTLGNAAKARGMTRLAKETGLARESLYRSLSAGGNPEFNTVLKVIASMGFRLMVGKAEDKPREG